MVETGLAQDELANQLGKVLKHDESVATISGKLMRVEDAFVTFDSTSPNSSFFSFIEPLPPLNLHFHVSLS